jgi:L-cysteine desulfidase
MDESRIAFFTGLLKRELVTAVGCTEPAAAALAAASARKALAGIPGAALVRASRDIIKNAMHAGIPHSALKGIHAAVALGLAAGDPDRGLNILADLDETAEAGARAYLDSGRITVELARNVPSLFIEVWLEGEGRRRGARVQGTHDRVEILGAGGFDKAAVPDGVPSSGVYAHSVTMPPAAGESARGGDISPPGVYAHSGDTVRGGDIPGGGNSARSGVYVHSVTTPPAAGESAYSGGTTPPDPPCAAGGPEGVEEFTLEELCDYVDSVPFAAIAWLIGAAATNMELARHSVEKGYGIQVGKTMAGCALAAAGRGEDYLFRWGAALAAAASDARMTGCPMPVVINSGSGNQGITVSVPVLVLAEGLGKGREETARALCLAQLSALMMTARKDRLSALCGAFTSAVGTAAGYVRLLGGSYDDLERCVNNMVGNLLGILCDGAKGSCALKIYTCVEAAAMGAKIAMTGHAAPPSEGVLGCDLEETLGRVRKISHEGMIPLDTTVLNIILEKG